MAQDHGLCRKRKSKTNRRTGRLCRPVLQLPTGQSCSLQTCCLQRSWRTWNEQGAKQNEQNGGKNVEGSGHGMGDTAGKHSLLNTVTAGGHSWQTICPAQASKQHNSQQTLAGLAAKTTAADEIGRPLAVQCR